MKLKLLLTRLRLHSFFERLRIRLKKHQTKRGPNINQTKLQLKVYITQDTRLILNRLTKRCNISNSDAVDQAINLSWVMIKGNQTTPPRPTK